MDEKGIPAVHPFSELGDILTVLSELSDMGGSMDYGDTTGDQLDAKLSQCDGQHSSGDRDPSDFPMSPLEKREESAV